MAQNKKIAPKIMKIISSNWDIKDVTQEDYFKVLGLVYNIEETVENSKKDKFFVN
tara:strand:- start:1170 stop:1334 length:165 start_codon:yes stop_codon:yes gene_type:complete